MHGPMRWVRGCTVGLAIVVLACVGHLSGGGGAHLGPVLLAWLLVTACALGGALSAHEWSVPRLVALLATTQAVCHVVLEVSMTTGGAMVDAPVPVTHHDLAGAASHTGVAGMTGMPAALPLPSPLMLLAHAAAIVLAAVVLHRADSWTLRAAEFVVRRGPRAHPRPLALPHLPLRVPVSAPVAHLVARLHLSDVARRGPPCGRRPVPALAA